MNCVRINTSACTNELVNSIKYWIPFISSDIIDIKTGEDYLDVYFNNDSAPELTLKIEGVIKEIKSSYQEEKANVIFESEGIHENKCNIYEELLERGWVVQYDNGLIGYGNEFLSLYNYFNNMLLEWGSNQNAQQFVYPDLIDIDTLNKCNYLSQFPTQVLFASHLQHNMDKIRSFSKIISDRKDCLSDQYLESPEYVNKTAVCIHVYKQFENKTLNISEPIIINSLGKCKRYESLNHNSMERLLDFSMREFVFIGSEDFVLNKRDEFIELAKSFVIQAGLKANIKTSNDPFFLNQYGGKAVLQKKFKLKYELNFYLPYAGKELAVGSFNFHGSYFSDAFNIKSLDKTNICTGCVAFGMERFAYGFLSQVGFEGIKPYLANR